MPPKKKFQPSDLTAAKQLYSETKNGHKVANQLGWGHTTVYRHLALGRRSSPTWTDDEIQVLVDGYMEKVPVREIAAKVGRSPRAVMIKMSRYRKQVKNDPKKRRALSAISLVFKAVRKADIFREMEE